MNAIDNLTSLLVECMLAAVLVLSLVTLIMVIMQFPVICGSLIFVTWFMWRATR